jgi:hypothetical protein
MEKQTNKNISRYTGATALLLAAACSICCEIFLTLNHSRRHCKYLCLAARLHAHASVPYALFLPHDIVTVVGAEAELDFGLFNHTITRHFLHRSIRRKRVHWIRCAAVSARLSTGESNGGPSTARRGLPVGPVAPEGFFPNGGAQTKQRQGRDFAEPRRPLLRCRRPVQAMSGT